MKYVLRHVREKKTFRAKQFTPFFAEMTLASTQPSEVQKSMGRALLCWVSAVQQLCVVREGLTPSSESRCYLLDRKFNPVFQN